MGYAERVLQPGETIAYRARLHWIVYLGGLVMLALAAGFGLAAALLHDERLQVVLAVVAVLALVIAFWVLVRAWILVASTEIIVTTRRVIHKTGFISRSTVEMNIDKVESVLVRQSLLGRMLDYGTVIVRGVGAGLEPVDHVSQPLELHRHVSAPLAA